MTIIIFNSPELLHEKLHALSSLSLSIERVDATICIFLLDRITHHFYTHHHLQQKNARMTNFFTAYQPRDARRRVIHDPRVVENLKPRVLPLHQVRQCQMQYCCVLHFLYLLRVVLS